MLLTLDLSLNSSVVNFADLLGVESSPLLVVEGPVERLDFLHTDKVDEGVSHVTVVEEVNRQVEEVKLVLELLIQRSQHLLLSVLVGYVPYHKRCPVFLNDFIRDDLKPFVVLHLLSLSQVNPVVLVVLLIEGPLLSTSLDLLFLHLQFFLQLVHEAVFSYRTF